jgi:protein-L-isoaspartate O-methyltransferase
MKTKPMTTDTLLFNEDSIISLEYGVVMMSWEKEIMEAHAKVIATGGDVLEIGFGMGLSATAIQEYGVSSHTIVEIHPEIAKRAREWAKDYPNATIIEAAWRDIGDGLGQYDGIFYDAESDPAQSEFPIFVKEKLIRPGGIFTWFNPNGVPNGTYEWTGPYDVSKAANNSKVGYINKPEYYVPFIKY